MQKLKDVNSNRSSAHAELSHRGKPKTKTDLQMPGAGSTVDSGRGFNGEGIQKLHNKFDGVAEINAGAVNGRPLTPLIANAEFVAALVLVDDAYKVAYTQPEFTVGF